MRRTSIRLRLLRGLSLLDSQPAAFLPFKK